MADIIDIFNLCASDPETGLKLIESIIREEPEVESEPIAKFAKAMVYASKGLRIPQARLEEEEILLTDEELNYLELALLEIKEIVETAPGFFNALAIPETKVCRDKVNAIVSALERHRPGRVQELLGEMKFKYDFFLADLPIENKAASLFNLCESDPHTMLGIFESMEIEHPLLRFAKALAYGGKGLFQLTRRKPEIDFTGFNKEKLRNVLDITDTHLDYLEKGLQEIKEMEGIYPGALKMFGTEEDRIGGLKVDGMAMVLERCRPGKVQQILGSTKLQYFGADRIWDILRWPAEKIRPFLNIPFSFSSIVKSAVVMDGGRDAKGREYIHCMLLWKLPEDFEPNETFGDARIGGIYIFDDGTFGHALPEEHNENKKEEPSEERQPKKKGFFKKLFG